MAGLDLSGMSDFDDWMDHVAEVPSEVKEEMLIAMADEVAKQQKEEARALLVGPYNKGAVAASVKRGEPNAGWNNPQIKVTFEGYQHGNRIGEIAFVNEYGKTNQPARPFVMIANAKAEPSAVEKAAEIFHKFMEG
ncbi:MAG: hypothetical protein IJI45_01450 [Anaerolineaceae bacterium]|nr:hypothetical protein [Anaerolineaceae bacterium]